jgi:hypothetical protein
VGWAVLEWAEEWRFGFEAEGGGLGLWGFSAGADGVEVDGVY